MPTRYVMIQTNDGSTCVTPHATEEEAYADIADTCLQAVEWLQLDPGGDADDANTLKEINEDAEKLTSKELYERHLEHRMQGEADGFYMKVEAVEFPDPESVNGRHVAEVTVVDPDTGLPVEVAIIKLETGGMMGVDSSYFNEDQPIYSPFDENTEVKYDEETTDGQTPDPV